MVFGSIFSNNFGLLNAFLQSIGLTQIEWLTQPWGIKVAIASIVTWRWVGYNAIIFLAGLQAISNDVYEAAKVDGGVAAADVLADHRPAAAPGDPVHRGPSTIGGLQIFTESQVLVGDTGGRAARGRRSCRTCTKSAFLNNQFGYGAAIGWALFILIVLFSIINWRLIGGGERIAAPPPPGRWKGAGRCALTEPAT